MSEENGVQDVNIKLLNGDVSIVKTGFPNPVMLGLELNYDIVVTNNTPSPGEIINVVVEDIIDSNLAFVKAGVIGKTITTTYVNGILSCNIGAINPSETVTLNITVIPKVAGTITNQATAKATALSGDMDYPSNTVTTTIVDVVTEVGNVKTTVDNTSTKVDGLTTTVNGISTTVTSIATEVGNVKTVVDSTSAKVDGLTTTVNNTATEVGNIKTTVDGTAFAVSNIGTTVTSTAVAVGNVQATVDSTSVKVDGLTTTVNNTETEVRNVKTTVDNTEITVNNIGSMVNDIGIIVSGTETKVDTIAAIVGSTETTVNNTSMEVGNVKTTVDGTAFAVNNIGTTVTSTAVAVGNVQATVDSTSAKVDGLTTTVNNTATEVGNIKTTVDNTAITVNSTATEVGSVKTTVQGTETKINDLTILATETNDRVKLIQQEIGSIVNPGVYTLTTGIVVRDYSAKSVVVAVENTTLLPISMVITLIDHTKVPFQVANKNITIDAKNRKSLVLGEPALEYEILFNGMSEGLYAWTATRINGVFDPLSLSQFISCNTFRHSELVAIKPVIQ